MDAEGMSRIALLEQCWGEVKMVGQSIKTVPLIFFFLCQWPLNSSRGQHFWCLKIYHKNSDTCQKNCCYPSKIWTRWLYYKHVQKMQTECQLHNHLALNTSCSEEAWVLKRGSFWSQEIIPEMNKLVSFAIVPPTVKSDYYKSFRTVI